MNLPTDTISLRELLHSDKDKLGSTVSINDAILSSTIPIDKKTTTAWIVSGRTLVVTDKVYKTSGDGVGLTILRMPAGREESAPDEVNTTVPIKLAVSTMNFNDMIQNGHGNQRILRKNFTFKPDDKFECSVQTQTGEPFHYLQTIDMNELVLVSRNTDQLIGGGGTIHLKTFEKTPDSTFVVSIKTGSNTHKTDSGIDLNQTLMIAVSGDLFVIDGKSYTLIYKNITQKNDTTALIDLMLA